MPRKRGRNKRRDQGVRACATGCDKAHVRKSKQKLRGSNVFIGEDFSLRERETRRKLTPHLNTAKDDGKGVTMVFDHLVIEGTIKVLPR